MVHVRVDQAALSRGRTGPGEVCEIPGVGPIPVAAARALSSDDILKAVLTDGVEVKAVAHLGRSIPAHLRTALAERDRSCAVPGCEVGERLEIDHIVPFAEGGPTSLENLARLCSFHHYLKTHRGYRLEGEPGRRRWRAPDEPRRASRSPPG